MAAREMRWRRSSERRVRVAVRPLVGEVRRRGRREGSTRTIVARSGRGERDPLGADYVCVGVQRRVDGRRAVVGEAASASEGAIVVVLHDREWRFGKMGTVG